MEVGGDAVLVVERRTAKEECDLIAIDVGDFCCEFEGDSFAVQQEAAGGTRSYECVHFGTQSGLTDIAAKSVGAVISRDELDAK